MRFFAVREGIYEGVQQRIDLFKLACEGRSIDYLDIDSLSFDYSNLPTLTQNDILYGISSGSQALISLLLNDDVTTFYTVNPSLNLITSTTEWSIQHEKLGLRTPRTIFSLPADRDLARKYVEALGGFPIVLKATGSTRGIGTLKIESWPSLFSTADYLLSIGSRFILRQFIQADYGVRAIVLNGEVITSSRFYFPPDDFRNAAILSSTRYEPCSLSIEDRKLCIDAVEGINLELGGVDLLYDKSGTAYLLEVNFPLGFHSLAGEASRVVGAMLDHLVRKATR
jgi:glutathione synthase/RimK-type ligase-like ATP-grasp enzyme